MAIDENVQTVVERYGQLSQARWRIMLSYIHWDRQHSNAETA